MSSFTVALDGARVVGLERAITTHNGIVKQVRLRQPTYKDFMDLGDPATMIVGPGTVFPHDDLPVIKQYVERLSDMDPLLLEQLSLLDALALRDAVKSFFTPGSVNVSTGSPTS